MTSQSMNTVTSEPVAEEQIADAQRDPRPTSPETIFMPIESGPTEKFKTTPGEQRIGRLRIAASRGMQCLPEVRAAVPAIRVPALDGVRRPGSRLVRVTAVAGVRRTERLGQIRARHTHAVIGPFVDHHVRALGHMAGRAGARS